MRQRTLEAVIAVLSEPPRLLSYEAIARRAGINRATLYRNWPEPAQLIADALRSMLPPPEEAEAEQDLAEILLKLSDQAQAVLRTAEGRSLAANVVAAAQSDPVISAAFGTYWQGRISRAAQATELPEEQVRALFTAIAGKLFFQALIFQEELSGAQLQEFITATLKSHSAD